MKLCSKCKRMLRFHSFWRDKTRESGYQSQCVSCRKPQINKYYPKQRAYLRTKIENVARYLVDKFIKNGWIDKPKECEECMKKLPSTHIQAHHWNGYNNPLDIVFLCHQCHKNRHRKTVLA